MTGVSSVLIPLWVLDNADAIISENAVLFDRSPPRDSSSRWVLFFSIVPVSFLITTLAPTLC